MSEEMKLLMVLCEALGFTVDRSVEVKREVIFKLTPKRGAPE